MASKTSIRKYGLFSKICLPLLFTVISQYAHAQLQEITTCAGTGASGYSGDGGAAIAARFSTPVCVASDASGNLYVSDNSANVIRKISSTGIITTVAGNGTAGYSGNGGPGTSAQLNAPMGIAADNAGNLYIADEQNNVVRKVDAAGIITTIAGTNVAGYGGDGGAATAAQLYYPSDVATDNAGNIYISDRYNVTIRKINASGTITTIAGIPDSVGYTGNGGPATAARIGEVYGIAVDHTGNLYIAESYPQHIIRKVNTSGIISLVAGDDSATYSGDGMPAISTRINGPGHIAIDDSDHLYFSDGTFNTIRKIDGAGILSTVAGNGHMGFGGDGGAPIFATMNNPFGITFDNTGNLYIADTYNMRIRKASKSTVGITNNSLPNNYSISPNPNSGIFLLRGIPMNEDAKLEVTDMTGKVIYEENMTAHPNNNELQITMPGSIPGGVYLVHITTNTVVKNFTISIIR